MEECIFCRIARGEAPCFRIWEDESCLAFLDIFPNTKGMALVIPKQHFGSDITKMPDKDYSGLMSAVKSVALLLEKSLGVKRVGIVAEGMGVNHAHVKLYPMHGLGDEWKPIISNEKAFFSEYPGFLTTKLGPKADFEKLEKLAKKIREYSEGLKA